MIPNGGPTVVARIEVVLLGDGGVGVQAVQVPANELLIRRVMAQATELLAAELAKARPPGIEVAGPEARKVLLGGG